MTTDKFVEYMTDLEQRHAEWKQLPEEERDDSPRHIDKDFGGPGWQYYQQHGKVWTPDPEPDPEAAEAEM